MFEIVSPDQFESNANYVYWFIEPDKKCIESICLFIRVGILMEL